MKFCPVVPEICRGQVHGAQKERRITRTRRRRIIIIIINNKKRSKNNKSPKLCLGDLIIIIICFNFKHFHFLLLRVVFITFENSSRKWVWLNGCGLH